MMQFSRFAHTFDLGEHVALWHSLRMQPVFLSKETYGQLIQGSCSEFIHDELTRKKILLVDENEDSRTLERIRGNIPKPDIGLGYFILSENCNLACKYCFVGSDVCGSGNSSIKNMTRQVAEKAIDVFARQLELSPSDYETEDSDIIFFGGEPLLQFDVLVYVVERVRELAQERRVLANTKFAVITNGTLLDEQKLLKLHELNVAISISIDGFTEKANEMRVDKAGQPTFGRVVDVLDLFRKLDLPAPSLSITLSEKTIDELPQMIELIRKYQIKGFGYNVLLSKDGEDNSDEYYEKASRFIIDSFLLLREDGVYEDRIMRKLNAFSSARIHFSDCGATSGGQILFAPDGRIGICQGLMNEDENYISDVWDDSFNANENSFWQMWASLVPLNEEECLNCEALGICGGGCPVNARSINPDKGLHCIDGRSCVHAKKTLKFLISDLYSIIRERNK